MLNAIIIPYLWILFNCIIEIMQSQEISSNWVILKYSNDKKFNNQSEKYFKRTHYSVHLFLIYMKQVLYVIWIAKNSTFLPRYSYLFWHQFMNRSHWVWQSGQVLKLQKQLESCRQDGYRYFWFFLPAGWAPVYVNSWHLEFDGWRGVVVLITGWTK